MPELSAPGQSHGSNGVGKKIQMGREIFAIVKFCSAENAAVVAD